MLKIASVLVAGILMATGCQSSPAPPSKTDQMVSAMRAEAPSLSQEPRASLVRQSRMVCSGLGGGMDLVTIIQMLFALGHSPQEAGNIVGASITFKCPEYETVLDNG